MKSPFLAFVIVSFCLLSSMHSAERILDSPKVSSLVQQVLTAASNMDIPPMDLPPRNPELVWNTLTEIAMQLDRAAYEESERELEASLTAKIVAMARHRIERPELYAQIRERYITRAAELSAFPDGTLPIAISAPAFLPEHITPEYRLVWESFHIDSYSGMPNNWLNTVLKAVVKIGDPRSSMLVGYRLERHATSPQLDSEVFVVTLVQLPGANTLRVLFSAIRTWEKEAPRRYQEGVQFYGTSYKNKNDPRAQAVRAFNDVGREDAPIAGKWREAFASVAADRLTPEDTALLRVFQKAVSAK